MYSKIPYFAALTLLIKQIEKAAVVCWQELT